MEPKYPRLKNQLKIHWYWLRLSDYKEAYNAIEAWLKTDKKIKEYEERNKEEKTSP